MSRRVEPVKLQGSGTPSDRTPDRRPAARLLTALPSAALLSCLLAGQLLTACGGGRSPLDQQTQRPLLNAWVTLSQDSSGAVQPLVSVSVPHGQLVFRREAGLFTAHLEVRVLAWRGSTQVGGGVARGTVSLEHDTATRTSTPLEVTVPLQVRGEEAVRLEVTAQVVGTTRSWRRELAYLPQTLTALPLWIAALHTNLAETATGELLVKADIDSIRLSAVLRRQSNGPGWPAGGIDLVGEISESAATEPRRQRLPVPVSADTAAVTSLTLTWPAERLPFGRWRLQVLLEAEQPGRRWRLPREPALAVINLRVPMQEDRDWRRHVAWLEDLLPQAVRDSLRALAAADRAEGWAEAWRRIAAAGDLSAAQAERQHLMRIITADERFGGFGRGSLSDRGRVYIRRGEPAQIETFADQRTAGAVFEIWIYSAAALRYVFYDAHGFGDFRLRLIEPL